MSLYLGKQKIGGVDTFGAEDVLSSYSDGVSACYQVIEEKGGTLPEEQTYKNLASSIETIKIAKYNGIPFYEVDSEGNAAKRGGNLVFDNIKEIDSNCFDFAFSSCSNLSSVSFPSLTSVGSMGLFYAFYSCSNLSSVSFPSLTSVGSSGLRSAFYSCSNLSSVSFPSLTSVGSYGLFYAFYSCSKLKEIHFRADAKSVIEAQDGYSDKFGATNATIYFDL